MKIAVGQFASSADKTTNIERISALTSEAVKAGARLVVFPEGAMHTFGALTDDLAPAAEPLDGRFVDNLTRLTDRLGVTVVAGMFESVPGDHRVYNTAVWGAPPAGLPARHRKRFLYDALSAEESHRMLAGTEGTPPVAVEDFTVAA